MDFNTLKALFSAEWGEPLPDNPAVVYRADLDTLHYCIDQYQQSVFLHTQSLETSEAAAVFIRLQQKAIIHFSDECWHQLRHKEQRALVSRSSLAAHVRQRGLLALLSELLSFFEVRFPEHFDHSLSVPEADHQFAAQSMRSKLRRLEQQMRERRIDQDLISLLSARMTSFIRKGAASSSELQYLFGVAQHFLVLLPRLRLFGINDLALELCYLNFNSNRIANWYKHYWAAQLKLADTDDGGHLSFAQLLKMCRQVTQRGTTAVNPQHISLRATFENWLVEEIGWMESSELKEAPPANTGQQNRIGVDLSVAQLAGLIRVMVEGGLFPHANQSELLNVFTRNFRTGRVDAISTDSLRNKYYNPDRGTMEAIRSLLLNLVQKSRNL